MKQTPHPSTLAAISSATGRRLQTSEVDDAGRPRSKTWIPKDYVAKNVAGFRFPDGRVARAYDMYDPTYPKGSEPGLVDVLNKVEHFPNDSSGYRSQILGFKSIEDIEASGVRVDLTAAALGRDEDGQDVLIIGRDEDDLARKLIERPLEQIQRPTIRTPIGHEGELTVFFGASAIGGKEIHAAATEDDLSDALRARYNFLEPEDDGLDAILDAITAHCEKPGVNWRIAFARREDEPEIAPGL